MMEPARTLPTHPRARNFSRLLPLLVVVVIGGLILKEEVPAVNRWYQSVVAPERAAAMEACHRAALQAAEQPDFARLRNQGNVHKTQNGFYIEGVTVGAMGKDGAETLFRVSCYADINGRLVKTHKEAG